VRNSLSLAGSDTGWGLFSIARSTRSTAIPNLLTLLLSDLDHRFVPEWVIFILTYLKDIGRAYLHAFTAAIALIGINGKEPVT